MKLLLSVIAEIVRAGALLLAFGCAALALAGQGGRFSDRLDVLNHFTPIWFVAALAAVALWALAGRHGRTTPVLALVAVLSTLTLMLPEIAAGWSQKRAPAAAASLKVIQFNIWAEKTDIKRATAWLLRQDADVILIEEGDAATATALKAEYPFYVTCAHPQACSSMIFAKSRPVAWSGLQTAVSDAHLPGAWATFRSPDGTEFTAANVHYVWPYPAGPQQQQAKRLAKVLDGLPKDHLILTGDFNSTPWSFSLRRQDRMFGLERRTRALASWPANAVSRLDIPVLFPVLPIDHVYAGKGWRTVSIKRGPRLGSDHYPIIAELARR